ncbi:MAG: hypothetical protein K6G26_05760 [Lachnospiraceae bacterium]|nr:hypothetical protein [Lachnospiraceae bacterium]
MEESRKKRCMVVLICIAIITVIMVAGFIIYRLNDNQQYEEFMEYNENDSKIYSRINYYYRVTDIIFTTEDNKEKLKTEFDEGFKEQIKDDSARLFTAFDLNAEWLDLRSMYKLLYIDSKWNLGHQEEIINALEAYYLDDYKLFNLYSNRKMVDLNEKNTLLIILQDNCDLMEVAGECNIDLNKYDYVSGIYDMINDNLNSPYKKYPGAQRRLLNNAIKSVCKQNLQDNIDKEQALYFVNYYYMDSCIDTINGKNERIYKGLTDDSVVYAETLGFEYNLSDYITEQLYSFNSDEDYDYVLDSRSTFCIETMSVNYCKLIDYLQEDMYLTNNIVRMVEDNYYNYDSDTIDKIINNQ